MPLKIGSSINISRYVVVILSVVISGQNGNCRAVRRGHVNRWISRQDGGQVVPILTPGVVEGISTVAGAASAADAYLPDLGFWADLGNLMLSGSSLSPMVRLSRDVLESQQCAEYVSCQLSHFSRNYSPLQFLHSFLQDLPFRGDLADRVKMGSIRSVKMGPGGVTKTLCGFDCSPLQYLNRGVKTLSLLHTVAKAANPRTDLSEL